MPQNPISKHSGYMKECGIDLQLISKTMKLLTVLQEINISSMQQILKNSDSSVQIHSHYLNKNFNKALSNRYLAQLNVQIAPQQSITSPDYLAQQQQTKNQIQSLDPKNSPKSQQQLQKAQNLLQKTDSLIQEIHHLYVLYHDSMIGRTYLFCKFRQIDVRYKFSSNRKTWDKLKQKKPYLNISKNLFLKAYFLEDYLKNTKIYFNDIGQSYPVANYYLNSPYQELDIIQTSVSHLKTEIQLDYSNKNSTSSSKAVRQLRNLVEITSIKPIGNPFILGFWMGAVILIILAIVFIIVFFQINFTTNTDFQKTFPIWRGLWYFIYLIWLMGLNTYIFNYFKVNFNLLTTYNNFHMPNPSRLITCAAIFTSIHFSLFLIYLIKLARIGNTLTNIPQQFLPGISWIIFIAFFIFPFKKLHFRQRLYPLKMFFRAIVSPILGVQWKFSLFIDLFVSFRQPIRDVIYSIHYYFVDDAAPYSETIIYQTIAGMGLYFFKIIVSSRQMYQNGIFGGTPLNSIYKSILGMSTIFASYLSKNDHSQFYYIYIWLVIALVSSSYSYYMDIWNDWGLLDKKHGYLRQKLMYRNRKIYYGIIFLNLILRFVWMMNVSPDVIKKFRIKPYITVIIISSIQITRRTIWMIFRVQNQHLNNQKKINKLFAVDTCKLKEIQTKQEQNKKNPIKKNLSWFKINDKSQNSIKQIKNQFQQKHQTIKKDLIKKLEEAETIAKNYSSEQEKYLLD